MSGKKGGGKVLIRLCTMYQLLTVQVDQMDMNRYLNGYQTQDESIYLKKAKFNKVNKPFRLIFLTDGSI